LAVDIFDCLFFSVAGVFFQSLENDREVGDFVVLVLFHFRVQKNRLHTTVDDPFDVVFLEHGVTFKDNDSTLNGGQLTGVLVGEILEVGFHHTGGKLTTQYALQAGLRNLHFLGEVEDVEDVLVGLIADGAQQGGDGQFLLAVDVGIHHVVNVRRKLHPRSFERDDTGRIKHGAVGVLALAEEHARRAV